MGQTETPVRLRAATQEQKAKWAEMMRKADAAFGQLPDNEPLLTVQEIRASMVANGVRPEDNLASREMIRIRECELD